MEATRTWGSRVIAAWCSYLEKAVTNDISGKLNEYVVSQVLYSRSPATNVGQSDLILPKCTTCY